MFLEVQISMLKFILHSFEDFSTFLEWLSFGSCWILWKMVRFTDQVEKQSLKSNMRMSNVFSNVFCICMNMCEGKIEKAE